MIIMNIHNLNVYSLIWSSRSSQLQLVPLPYARWNEATTKAICSAF